MVKHGRRIVVVGLNGLTSIIGTEADLNGQAPAVIAYGNFQQAKLMRVEKYYVLYRELPEEEHHASA